MPLLTCKLCGKVFSTPGGRTCPECLKKIDDLYPRVREYLRDNPKIDFNVDSLADALETDIRYVQALTDMGYLDRDLDKRAASNMENRQKLAQEFENTLKQMKQTSARDLNKNVASYGEQRYGERNKKK